MKLYAANDNVVVREKLVKASNLFIPGQSEEKNKYKLEHSMILHVGPKVVGAPAEIEREKLQPILADWVNNSILASELVEGKPGDETFTRDVIIPYTAIVGFREEI